MDKKDVIIIGGGVSGLSCGIHCLKQGLNATIIEKTNSLGGNLTGWFRNDCYIDNCIHWLNGSKQGSHYNKMWQEVGAINEQTAFHQSEYFFVCEKDGKKIGFNKDINKTKVELLNACPNDKKQIYKFISAVKNACELTSSKSKIKQITGALKIFLAYGNKTISQVAKSCKSELLKCFFTDYLSDRFSIYIFLLACASFASGDGKVPTMGSLQMSKNMAQKFESMGGKVVLNQAVNGMTFANKNAVKISTKTGSEYTADYFVFACDPKAIFTHILPQMPKVLKKTYSKRKTYPLFSSFHVAYDVAMPHVSIPESLIINCAPITIGTTTYTRLMLKNYAYGKNFAPKGHIVLQVFLLQNEADYNYFASLSPEQYKQCKKEISEQITNQIVKRFKSLRGKITQIDCWTPLSYTHYFNAYKGSYMSFCLTNKIRISKVKSKLKGYNNIYLATQWQTLFGGLPNALTMGKQCATVLAKAIKKPKQTTVSLKDKMEYGNA